MILFSGGRMSYNEIELSYLKEIFQNAAEFLDDAECLINRDQPCQSCRVYHLCSDISEAQGYLNGFISSKKSDHKRHFTK